MAETLLGQAGRELERIDSFYRMLLEQYGLEEKPYELSESYVQAESLVPRCLSDGPLSSSLKNIREELGDERADWYSEYFGSPTTRLGGDAFEILNLVDGEHSQLRITRAPIIWGSEYQTHEFDAHAEHVLYSIEFILDGLTIYQWMDSYSSDPPILEKKREIKALNDIISTLNNYTVHLERDGIYG